MAGGTVGRVWVFRNRKEMTAQDAFNIARTFGIQMSESEGELLFNTAARAGDCPVIVEIGTKFGGSAYLLGAGVARDGIVFTIDNYSEDIVETPEAMYRKALENLRPLTNVCALKGESVILAEILNFRLDMFFHDGSHIMEDVEKDLEAWLPHVKTSGFVCFHDYESHTGITLAVNKYLEDGRLEKVNQDMSLLVTKKV